MITFAVYLDGYGQSLRVSQLGETLSPQQKAMRQYARQRSWKVIKAVEDVGSGGPRPRAMPWRFDG